ncbi:phosphotransferase [Embleya sp. NBC_00896]|uniref:phosphotransferase n=1 Tax=Embleya sp. NBC_00896 TaxID=2975961 RepID=UPI003866FB73|nr:phosphotransferase [Embleya sp. NBC_00896]
MRVESVPPELGSLLGAAPLSTDSDVWHVSGSRADAVLKLATPDGTAPANPRYWAREVKAYDSGLAHTVYASYGLTAPRLLQSDPRGDGSVALWLDFVRGSTGTTWDLARWIDFARRLGAAQAVPRPFGPTWLFQSPAPDGPLAARAAAFPPVLCHLDLRPVDLIARDRDVVLLDWSHAGYGLAGEDLAGLILAHAAEPELVSALDRALPAEYARAAAVPEADVRVAIAATAPARFGPGADAATRRVLRMWAEDAPAY